MRKYIKIFSAVSLFAFWLLELPVTVQEGIPAWREWAPEVVMLYSMIGPWALLFPTVLTVAWWLYFYPPWRKKPKVLEASASASATLEAEGPAPQAELIKLEDKLLAEESARIREARVQKRLKTGIPKSEVIARLFDSTLAEKAEKEGGPKLVNERVNQWLHQMAEDRPEFVSHGRYNDLYVDRWIAEQERKQ